MVHHRVPGFTALVAAILATPLAATHPEVNAVYPRGARQGSETTLKIYGQRLQSISGITFFKQGIVVLEIKPQNAGLAEVRIKIAKDCPLGNHPLLVRTARGFSNLHLFFVGTLTEVSEDEPNNSRSECRVIKLESTVNGRIKPADLDVFAVDVKKGQRVNIEVQGLRLGDQEFDPHLTVTDSQGRRLAMVDDTIFGRLDPLTSLECKVSGRWYITLRENARGGSSTSFYRLHVGTFPRPLAAFPAGGKPGQKIKVRYLTENGGFDGSMVIPPAGIHRHFVKTNRGTSPTPLHIVSSPRSNLLDAGKAKQPPPCAIGAWSLIGPFANPRNKKGASTGLQTAYPPEKGFNANAKYKGRDADVSWLQQKKLSDNVNHDLRKLIKQSDNSVVYLHRNIQSASARHVLCILRGDDSIRAWCNGKPSPVSKDKEQRLILNLQKGNNKFL
ncbi:MAG: hypothetical protein VX951_07955, partial [Planctomycetota bacterium]|nr:hypothetical protein [Planctomycetota bacterium]